jgi:hypothetical protein
MVYIIRAKNPAMAWLRAAKYILANGEKVGELKKEALDLC